VRPHDVSAAAGNSELVVLPQHPNGDVVTGRFVPTSVIGKGTFKTVHALECSDGADRVICTFYSQANAIAARDTMELVADVFLMDEQSLRPNIFCQHQLVVYGTCAKKKIGVVMKRLDPISPSHWPAVLEIVEIAIGEYNVCYSDVKSTNLGLDGDGNVMFIDLDSVTRPGNYNMYGSYTFIDWPKWLPPCKYGGESPDVILARGPTDTTSGKSTYADAYSHYARICDEIADICDADVPSMRALTRYAALTTALVMKTTEQHPAVTELTVSLLGSPAATAMYAKLRDDCLTSVLYAKALARGALRKIQVE